MDTIGPYPLDSIITGDARELAQAIPDESVDLIFTDPVYWQIDDYGWLATTAKRLLKQGGSLLVYAGHLTQTDSIVAMSGKGLSPQPMLTAWMSPPHFQIWKIKLLANYSFVIWFSQGDPILPNWVSAELGQSLQGKNTSHKWGKNFSSVLYYIEKFTVSGAIIFDPFTGGGTVPAVCKMLGRRYLAFEIDPATADRARARVLATQPPLFVPEAVQQEMTL